MWVLNVALIVFQQHYLANWDPILVGAMFYAIPVLIVFSFFSWHNREGLAYAGVKG